MVASNTQSRSSFQVHKDGITGSQYYTFAISQPCNLTNTIVGLFLARCLSRKRRPGIWWPGTNIGACCDSLLLGSGEEQTMISFIYSGYMRRAEDERVRRDEGSVNYYALCYTMYICSIKQGYELRSARRGIVKAIFNRPYAPSLIGNRPRKSNMHERRPPYPNNMPRR